MNWDIFTPNSILISYVSFYPRMSPSKEPLGYYKLDSFIGPFKLHSAGLNILLDIA